ncbi:MAG: hypothetical protein HKN56_08675 [Gammaproteobacteria bacterium]|nr:hypothetical protein [Gammaproteobacteria bacterium]
MTTSVATLILAVAANLSVALSQMAGAEAAEARVEVATHELTVGERPVPMRILYRSGDKARAVIILSHGTFSSGRKYDAVARPWAARGYVVILPDHRDADFGTVPRSVNDMMGIIESRVDDVRSIATALPSIAAALDQSAADWASAPLYAAGHSVGTQVAMQVTGLQIRHPETGAVTGYPESRFDGAILLSDPGKMAAMPDHVWEAGNQPVFMATGPEDVGLMGDGRRDLGFENEVLMPADADDRYRVLLSIEGLDHQFGGLVQKETEGDPDHHALQLFVQQSLQFLARCDADSVAPAPGRLSDRAVVSVTAGRNGGRGC